MKKYAKQTIKLYWGYVLRHKFVVFVMFAASTVTSVIAVYLPFLYKRFFNVATDASTEARKMESLVAVLVLIVGWQAGQWVSRRAGRYLSNYFHAKSHVEILFECFAYLHLHSFRFFTNSFVGSLVTRTRRFVRAFDTLVGKIYWNIWPLVIQLGFIIVILTIMFPILGLGMMVWTVLFTIAQVIFSRWKWKYDIERAAAQTRTTAYLADTITNNINIKLFTSTTEEKVGFQKVLDTYYRLRKFTFDLNATADAVRAIFTIALEFGVLYFGAKMWAQGVLTVGDFALFQAYIFIVIHRIWDLGNILQDMYEAVADAEEMTIILNTKHEVRDVRQAKELVVKKGAVSFKAVDFNYHKTRSVLKKFSLKIAPGERIALVGPSGAGKSTIIKLLFRFFDLTAGKITIDGQVIKQVTQHSLREAISLVPQDPILFHRSLMENIRYGRRDATDEEVIEAAKLAHCHEFIIQTAQGYDTLVGERGIKLSGGERQRVAIARAILKNAPIIVLDEATSSLDSHSEMLIQDALKALMKGKTTIVIAHRLSTIMQMDRIIVLEDGKIVEEGSHKVLLRKKAGLYKKLWDLQAGGFIA